MLLFGWFFPLPCLRAPGRGVPGFLAGPALVFCCCFSSMIQTLSFVIFTRMSHVSQCTKGSAPIRESCTDFSPLINRWWTNRTRLHGPIGLRAKKIIFSPAQWASPQLNGPVQHFSDRDSWLTGPYWPLGRRRKKKHCWRSLWHALWVAFKWRVENWNPYTGRRWWDGRRISIGTLVQAPKVLPVFSELWPLGGHWTCAANPSLLTSWRIPIGHVSKQRWQRQYEEMGDSPGWTCCLQLRRFQRW